MTISWLELKHPLEPHFVRLLRDLDHADTLTDEQLYDEYPEAMSRHEFKPEPDGAWILGRQVATMIDDPLSQ